MTAAAISQRRAEVAARLTATAQPIADDHSEHRDCVGRPCHVWRAAKYALLLAEDTKATVDQLADARRELDDAAAAWLTAWRESQ